MYHVGANHPESSRKVPILGTMSHCPTLHSLYPTLCGEALAHVHDSNNDNEYMRRGSICSVHTHNLNHPFDLVVCASLQKRDGHTCTYKRGLSIEPY